MTIKYERKKLIFPTTRRTRRRLSSFWPSGGRKKLLYWILYVWNLRLCQLLFSSLRISPRFHYEAPWPSAQAEIRRLAAYKTPQDKVNCVVRCSQTIMNLLSMATKPGQFSICRLKIYVQSETRDLPSVALVITFFTTLFTKKKLNFWTNANLTTWL